MDESNTTFETALEGMQRFEEATGARHTDMHSEVQSIREAVSKALKECKLHRKPYDIRKDNRWDIHFDYQIEPKAKKSLREKISKAIGVSEKDINIISRYN